MIGRTLTFATTAFKWWYSNQLRNCPCVVALKYSGGIDDNTLGQLLEVERPKLVWWRRKGGGQSKEAINAASVVGR
jgi:hypothetical protein